MSKIEIKIFIIFLSFSFILTDLDAGEKALSEEESSPDSNSDDELLKKLNASEIIKLNDSNYAEEMKKYENLYLLVYAPWCGHCQHFIPEYVKASKYFIDQKPEVKFAMIDGEKNEKASKEFEIEGYPSIFFFLNGTKYEYNGSRTKEGLIKYFSKILKGPIYNANSIGEIDLIFKEHNKVLISTIKDKNLLLYKSFESFADENDEFEVISCLSKECIKQYGKDEIILLKDFDEKINYYSKDYEPISKANNDSITLFIGIFGMQNGGKFNEKGAEKLFSNNKKGVFYFRDSKNEKHTFYDTVFKNLGKELRLKNIYTFTSDIKGDRYLEECAQYFSLSSDQLPVVLFYDIIEGDDENAFTYRIKNANEKQLSLEYLKKYIEDIQDGNMERDLRSSFLGNPIEIKGVKRVFGITYDRDVIEEKNNVCILLVDEQSDCELCSNYTEVFANLGQKYSEGKNKRNDIIFEIMNIANNEPRDIELTFFEDGQIINIYLYTNALKEKKVIKFMPKMNNTISEDEIEKFIAHNLGWKDDKIIDGTKTDL